MKASVIAALLARQHREAPMSFIRVHAQGTPFTINQGAIAYVEQATTPAGHQVRVHFIGGGNLRFGGLPETAAAELLTALSTVSGPAAHKDHAPSDGPDLGPGCVVAYGYA